jgi:hypothetical protein
MTRDRPPWTLVPRLRCWTMDCPARDLSAHPAHGRCARSGCLDRGTEHASPHRMVLEEGGRVLAKAAGEARGHSGPEEDGTGEEAEDGTTEGTPSGGDGGVSVLLDATGLAGYYLCRVRYVPGDGELQPRELEGHEGG